MTLLARPHSTTLPSPKRYRERYESRLWIEVSPVVAASPSRVPPGFVAVAALVPETSVSMKLPSTLFKVALFVPEMNSVAAVRILSEPRYCPEGAGRSRGCWPASIVTATERDPISTALVTGGFLQLAGSVMLLSTALRR